jgi:kinesin family member 6/9
MCVCVSCVCVCVCQVLVPTETATGTKGEAKMQYNFRFQAIFGPETTQEAVFETTSKVLCDRFLEGYNGTIFAYGQTGSGKTHTIEGGVNAYEERGLLPRCLSYIYARLAERPEPVSIQITYLEIYNDTAYDLLNASSGANARLPKVSVQDQGKSCVIHNLSVHGAPTEDVATNLHFIGECRCDSARRDATEGSHFLCRPTRPWILQGGQTAQWLKPA